MTKSFLSLNDLAEIAGVTPMTVYRWIRYSDLSKDYGTKPLTATQKIAKTLGLACTWENPPKVLSQGPKQKIGRRYMFRTAEAMEWLENGGPQRAIDARKAKISEKVA